MNVLIVLAHPERQSYNSQMVDVAREALVAAGHVVEVSDLYGAGFDPREAPGHYGVRLRTDSFDAQSEQRFASKQGALPADVRAELDRVEWADLVIFQFPVWWFGPPAMMKGWLDRVLVYGGLYTSKMRYDRGYLRGKRAMLSVTLGGAEPTFAYNGRNGDIDLLLWPVNMSLSYVGMTVLPPFTAFEVGDLRSRRGVAGEATEGDPEVVHRLERYQQEYRERLACIESIEPLRFNGWDDWDETGRLKPGVAGYSPFMRAEP